MSPRTLKTGPGGVQVERWDGETQVKRLRNERTEWEPVGWGDNRNRADEKWAELMGAGKTTTRRRKIENKTDTRGEDKEELRK